MSVTGLQVLNAAYAAIGVKALGQSLQTAEVDDGLLWLNRLVGNWNIQGLTSLTTDRHVFNITANVATYSIGPGGTGTYLTGRPTSITNAGILLNTSSHPVEMPIGIMTDDMYAGLSIKTLTNTQFTQVYYNQTFPNGTIFVWPTPTIATNQLVLYYQTLFASFADTTTGYDLAPGYELALIYNLAVQLATPNGRDLPPLVLKLARDTLSDLKSQNVIMTDLSFDAALTGGGYRGWYNINTDQP